MHDAAGDGPDAVVERQASDIRSWRGAVSGTLLGFDVEGARPERFRGSITWRGLGDTALVAMTARPHRAVRGGEHIDDRQRPDYLLSLQLAGRAEFCQDDRRTTVGPGDMVFYDSTRPVEITSGEGYRSLCFRFPRSRVGGPPQLGDLTATTLDAAHGLTPAMAGLLTGLHRTLAQPGGPARRGAVRATARTAIELARTLFADELAGRGLGIAPDPHEEMRERADSFIDEHLADAALAPRDIAAALFVSPRYLHGVFADDDRTVAGTIRRRRLERTLADLADPRDAATPVSAIATRWGLTNATRFGQLVKQATGRTPVAYRRAMLGT